MNLSQDALRSKAVNIAHAKGDLIVGMTADGELYGDVEALRERLQPQQKPRMQRTYWSAMPELKPVLDLQPNQAVFVRPPAGLTPNRLQKVVCAIACSRFGKGRYTTAVAPEGVEIVRFQQEEVADGFIA